LQWTDWIVQRIGGIDQLGFPHRRDWVLGSVGNECLAQYRLAGLGGEHAQQISDQ
jgi:hypothetical protein